MPIRSYVRSTDFHRKPCGKNVVCRVDIPVMVLHSQILDGTSCKEVAKRGLQMPQSLLQGNTTHLIEKNQVILLFLLCQHCRAFNVPDSFVLTVPSFRSGSQSAVIDYADDVLVRLPSAPIPPCRVDGRGILEKKR